MPYCERMTNLITGTSWSNQKLVLLHEGDRAVEAAIVERYSDDFTYVVRGLKFCPWCGKQLDVAELLADPRVEQLGEGDHRPGGAAGA